ncbi:transcriptional regulator/sugar kinase [Arthrobacter crystallopoietes BAB-32]|uniref:Transcriptional regulator/sugar kinase n=1 Tax=Arthrobacter crystallopoietes BAB-32 TaxID=1246476 RepID=N1UYD4_9MICC|nr:ROK family transcriptional regulator [Arthrobacter crystallopoietes]EMY32847.1 transcriptional regulator/sugar kinase [Arthrobacter crystallopoietes BAB-32]
MSITANTPQVLRRTNLKAVLDVMRGGGTCTGSDLMERTGLTRATVIAVCDDLVRRGWVRELVAERNGAAQKGRPARRFAFNEEAGCVLGLDLGVATVTAQVADLNGNVLGRAAQRIPGKALEATAAVRLETITSTVDRALQEAGLPTTAVLAVGIGVATVVDRHGNIAGGHQLSAMFDLGLQTEVWRDRAWPVLLENDANLAALAERWRGIAQGTDDLAVMLTGERLGAGLIESGRLLHGRNGGAGEVGTLQLVAGVGSRDGIARLARQWGTQALAEGRQTLIRELVGPETNRVSARFVFEAAAREDAVALEILDRIARRMARVIAVLGTFLDPELVVIAGAVAKSAVALLPTINQELPALTDTPPRVEVSQLGDGIVATGAVRLALDYVEENMVSLTPLGQPAVT